MQGFCIALGAIAAAAFPWLLEQFLDLGPVGHSNIPRPPLKLAYYFGAVVILAPGTLWTFWQVDEPFPKKPCKLRKQETSDHQTENSNSFWSSLRQATGSMPAIMRRLAGVQILTWVGIYALFLYLPTAIAPQRSGG